MAAGPEARTEDAPDGPHVHGGGVVGAAEEHLRSAVPEGHNLRAGAACGRRGERGSGRRKRRFRRATLRSGPLGPQRGAAGGEGGVEQRPRGAARLVGVALDRHGEGAAEAEVGNLERVRGLVHEEVLRLQVSARGGAGEGGRRAVVRGVPSGGVVPGLGCSAAAGVRGAAVGGRPVHDAVAVEVRHAEAQLVHEVLRGGRGASQPRRLREREGEILAVMRFLNALERATSAAGWRARGR